MRHVLLVLETKLMTFIFRECYARTNESETKKRKAYHSIFSTFERLTHKANICCY